MHDARPLLSCHGHAEWTHLLRMSALLANKWLNQLYTRAALATRMLQRVFADTQRNMQ